MVKSFTSTLLKAAALSSVMLCAANAQADEKLYLCDVATEAELTQDVCGVPQACDDLGNYKFRARYYNENANTPIYFLTSKTSFDNAWGLQDGEFAMDDVDNLDPIILPEANTYYEIVVDTDNFEYTVTPYEVADYMDPVIWETGSENMNKWNNFVEGYDDGVYVHTDDATLIEFYIGYATGPNDVVAFTQDATNPHLYYTTEELYFEGGEELSFIIHNYHGDGWWNYVTWRVDDSQECDIWHYYGWVATKEYLEWWYDQDVDLAAWHNGEDYRKQIIYGGGGDAWAKPTVEYTGEYRLVFDSHLGRAKMIPFDSWEPVLGINSAVVETVKLNVIGNQFIFGSDVKSVQLYNLNGMQVGLTATGSRTYTTSAANGIYVLRYADANGKITSRKVVIR